MNSREKLSKAQQRRELRTLLGQRKGCLQGVTLAGILMLAACAGDRRAASALDGFRQLHYSLCIEQAQANSAPCERAYQQLRTIEPEIEDAMDTQARWNQMLADILPWLEWISSPAGVPLKKPDWNNPENR